MACEQKATWLPYKLCICFKPPSNTTRIHRSAGDYLKENSFSKNTSVSCTWCYAIRRNCALRLSQVLSAFDLFFFCRAQQMSGRPCSTFLLQFWLPEESYSAFLPRAKSCRGQNTTRMILRFQTVLRLFLGQQWLQSDAAANPAIKTGGGIDVSWTFNLSAN